LYDADNSGSLNFEEMSAVIRMLEDFEGSKQKDGEAEDQIVNQLFQSLVKIYSKCHLQRLYIT